MSPFCRRRDSRLKPLAPSLVIRILGWMPSLKASGISPLRCHALWQSARSSCLMANAWSSDLAKTTTWASGKAKHILRIKKNGWVNLFVVTSVQTEFFIEYSASDGSRFASGFNCKGIRGLPGNCMERSAIISRKHGIRPTGALAVSTPMEVAFCTKSS